MYNICIYIYIYIMYMSMYYNICNILLYMYVYIYIYILWRQPLPCEPAAEIALQPPCSLCAAILQHNIHIHI